MRPTLFAVRFATVLALAAVLAACGGSSPTPTSPSSATSPPTTPTPPTGPVVQLGKLDDLQAAQDIIDWNMHASGGSSYRKTDRICRWELPVPVYIQAGADRERVIGALDYWASQTIITYRLLTTDTMPRLLVRSGTDGLAAWGGGRSVLDGTNADNSARSGLVVFEPGGGTYCTNGPLSASCLYLYRHELGHTLGIYVNTDAGLMGSATNLSDREKRMLAALYSLPHGAAVEADGSWKVVK
jgi:hypothetical protein